MSRIDAQTVGNDAHPAEPATCASRPLEPLRTARRDAAAAFEREYVRAALTITGGNITRAAELAQVSRQMIQKLMRKYGL